jgi:hypothetical protein
LIATPFLNRQSFREAAKQRLAVSSVTSARFSHPEAVEFSEGDRQ